ncbi:photosynthetic reaction center cytochrome PufC [Hoeflea olei]|uniref:Photosynthetic reaction center cytochrome c subunit n=1 Tax=Hoeflea olei TaxID=1480615 RepID=A0A1C1YYA4_9HYPH|nr:photosynthetic reaction center cytochrome PufC [Hoeflea olei]OCW58488.1 Photosynthetic reaction center cytochrome C subunit [Hoeflea olei]
MNQLWIPFAAAGAVFVGAAIIFGADWDTPPVDSVQIGYRGSGMVQVLDREDQAALKVANAVLEPAYQPDPAGPRANEVYQNVQVLGHLSEDEFNELMFDITQWVSPVEGCNYCHNPDDLASDEVYTKVVSRRMLQMTQHINEDWQPHVAQTGVTCYTCHRGQTLPANVWAKDSGPGEKGRAVGWRGGQNIVNKLAANTSLPTDALESYLLGEKNIRVHSLTALPDGTNKNTVKETEESWALMMHMSESLGVGCITCHNTRAFNDWDQSPTQRVTAWHGIRLTRDLNNAFMTPMEPVFPANRKGPEGDVFKVSCNTCHNGVQKPMYGASMLENYVKSLGTQTERGVPDFNLWKEGETKVLAPTNTSSLAPASGAEEKALASAD